MERRDEVVTSLTRSQGLCRYHVMSRKNKRSRTAAEGGSYHNFVPLGADDFFDVHCREDRVRKVGFKSFTVPPTRFTRKDNNQWRTAASWAPSDDPEFALDPNGTLYEEAVEAPVMEDRTPQPVTVEKKRERSKVSVSLDTMFTLLNIFLLHVTEATSSCLEGTSSIHLLG